MNINTHQHQVSYIVVKIINWKYILFQKNMKFRKKRYIFVPAQHLCNNQLLTNSFLWNPPLWSVQSKMEDVHFCTYGVVETRWDPNYPGLVRNHMPHTHSLVANTRIFLRVITENSFNDRFIITLCNFNDDDVWALWKNSLSCITYEIVEECTSFPMIAVHISFCS